MTRLRTLCHGTLCRGTPCRVVLLLLAAVLLTPAGGPPSAAQPGPTFERSALAILAGGRRHEFTVEIARTADQLSYGLMFRERLPANAGMLFDYRSVQPVSMWMKNTFIPLDMLFVDAAGTVVKVVERTVPQSTRLIASGAPVRAVLELNGGTAARLGIRPGDRVEHPIFAAPRQGAD